MPDSYMDGGVTVWCNDDHDPKLLKGQRTVQFCPECGMAYRVESSIEKMPSIQKDPDE